MIKLKAVFKELNKKKSLEERFSGARLLTKAKLIKREEVKEPEKITESLKTFLEILNVKEPDKDEVVDRVLKSYGLVRGDFK